MDKTKCESLYSEPETEEHINGKRDLYEWIKIQNGVTDAVLEGWIPETRQRPDIMFKYNDKQCVIEFQCSPIATEYYERHDLYRSSGICDIWICGIDKYTGPRKRMNILEDTARLYYNPTNKQLYKFENLTEYEVKQIQKIESIRGCLDTTYRQRQYRNRSFHVMKNFYDYLPGITNYYQLKDISNSYCCVGSHYPSPTGRPSNKYPYPVKDYKYKENNSYVTCYRLSDLKICGISGGAK